MYVSKSSKHLVTMRFVSILALLGLHLFQCDGASTGESSSQPNPSVSYRYSEQEDKFIVEELARLPLDDLYVYSKPFWENIANNHRKKWQEKARGFPQERTWEGMLGHFKRMVKLNNQLLNTKIPSEVLRRFRKDLNKPAIGIKAPYTEEENKIIVEELLSPSCINPFGMSTMRVICAKLAEQRVAGNHGFENERTANALRTHANVMKVNGKLPDEVLKKVKQPGKGNKAGSSSASNLQETNEETEDEGDATKASPGILYRYTKQEDEFIIDQLLRLPLDNLQVFSKSLWRHMEEEHRKLRQENPHGFPQERTLEGLRGHFKNMLSFNNPQLNIRIPENVLRRF